MTAAVLVAAIEKQVSQFPARFWTAFPFSELDKLPMRKLEDVMVGGIG
jgi:hypothetical protein